MTADATSPSLPELLARDHRRLDDLFGRFLAVAGANDLTFVARAMREFDTALRRHTELEEEHLFPAWPGEKLSPAPGEGDRDRLFRELRLEHVQIREVSGMMARLLDEGNDVAGARALAGNLARRWDTHTKREEGEAYPLLSELLDPAGEAAIRDALSGWGLPPDPRARS